jgi:hypothetical protein
LRFLKVLSRLAIKGDSLLVVATVESVDELCERLDLGPELVVHMRASTGDL